jgi:hypothetical protein
MLLKEMNILEALAFSAFVALYMWRLQAAHAETWIVFPAWLILSFVLHRDTPKTLGWRADNLWPATRRATPIFVAFVVGLFLVGATLGAFRRWPAHFIDSRRLLGYFAFCVLQQVALQSLTMNRLLAGLESQMLAAGIAGAIFGALHWPNPVLVPLTAMGGAVMCWLFAKERNILPLFIGQTILGALVWWAFPLAWHHSMRVGPGYYNYILR